VRSSRPEGRPPLWPVVLTAVGSVGLFVGVLGVAAFLLRDVQFVDAPLVRAPVGHAAPGVPISDAPLGDAELRSARTAIAPLVPICLAEARARDPSVPSSVTLQAELEAGADSGVVRALRIKRGASPFLQHCFNQRGVGARFPVGAAGRATVRWRATVVDGAGVLEPLE